MWHECVLFTRFLYIEGKAHCFIAVMAGVIPALKWILQGGMPWRSREGCAYLFIARGTCMFPFCSAVPNSNCVLESSCWQSLHGGGTRPVGARASPRLRARDYFHGWSLLPRTRRQCESVSNLCVQMRTGKIKSQGSSISLRHNLSAALCMM